KFLSKDGCDQIKMPLSRRKLLKQTATSLAAAIYVPRFFQAFPVPSDSTTRIKFNPSETLAIIPPDFIGLGYETSTVGRPGLLSPTNTGYIQLVKTLGKQGVIRIGGNTSDYAFYAPQGQAASVPENQGGSVINDAVLRDLGGFLDKTGWRLIWGLNL